MKHKIMKIIAVSAVVLSLAASSAAEVFAADTEATSVLNVVSPDISSMTVDEWMQYEFHTDYTQIFSDVTSYTHKDLREMLDIHWSHYIQLTSQDNNMTDQQKADYLTEWHNAREAIKPIKDPVSSRIYLWPDQAPAITSYTENAGYQYGDDPSFQPYLLTQLTDNTEIKGAVILAAGGGDMYRSNVEEAYEVSLVLSAC